jgi:hypothetical protein
VNRIEVESSSIRSIGYDKSDQILEVEFLNGTVYRYSSVPESVYLDLMKAESHGRYFNQKVQKNFAFEKV